MSGSGGVVVGCAVCPLRVPCCRQACPNASTHACHFRQSSASRPLSLSLSSSFFLSPSPGGKAGCSPLGDAASAAGLQHWLESRPQQRQQQQKHALPRFAQSTRRPHPQNNAASYSTFADRRRRGTAHTQNIRLHMSSFYLSRDSGGPHRGSALRGIKAAAEAPTAATRACCSCCCAPPRRATAVLEATASCFPRPSDGPSAPWRVGHPRRALGCPVVHE